MTITDEMIEAFGLAYWPVNAVMRIDANREELRAALTAALAAAPEEKVTNGWRLVPIAPTEEMIDCGWSSSTVTSARDAEKIYRAMVAAAPTTPIPQGGEKGEPVAWHIPGSNSVTKDHDVTDRWRLGNPRSDIRPLYTHPAPNRNETLEEGWQPIETAPKDAGKRVDIWLEPHDAMVSGNAHRRTNSYYSYGDWWFTGNGVAYDVRASDHWRVTHWMPIPAPPRALSTPSDNETLEEAAKVVAGMLSAAKQDLLDRLSCGGPTIGATEARTRIAVLQEVAVALSTPADGETECLTP